MSVWILQFVQTGAFVDSRGRCKLEMGTRHAVCPGNESLALYILEKRELFIQTEGYKENLDTTLSKAYRNVCDSKDPICSLKDASKVKGIGSWMLKLLKGFFQEKTMADCTTADDPKAKRSKPTKMYVPQKSSAPYAILVTLYRAMEEGSEFMLKQELIDSAEASGLSRMPIQPNKSAGPSSQFGFSTKDWYSGWSSMKTLIDRGLVVKSSCPAKYMLTEEGKVTAEECMVRSGLSRNVAKPNFDSHIEKANEIVPASSGFNYNAKLCSYQSKRQIEIRTAVAVEDTGHISTSIATSIDQSEINSVVDAATEIGYAPDILSSDSKAVGFNVGTRRTAAHYLKMRGLSACNSSIDLERKWNSIVLHMPPLNVEQKFSDQYDFVIVLDDREQFVHDGKGLNSKVKFADRLKAQYQIEVEIRHLPVGDTIWLARHKISRREYVLDFVVERKKVSDLLNSIRDTRYKQQKLRLMRCGLQKLIYLVEGDPNMMESSERIKTACFTTELVEGFDVQRTRDIAETLRKYGELTHAIMKRYNEETGTCLMSQREICRTYDQFLQHCVDLEKEKVIDVFGVMLMQVKHVTEEIALSVLEKYPTPLALALVYSKLEGDVTAQEELLKGMPIRNQCKAISGIISKNIYKFIWSSEGDFLGSYGD